MSSSLRYTCQKPDSDQVRLRIVFGPSLLGGAQLRQNESKLLMRAGFQPARDLFLGIDL